MSRTGKAEGGGGEVGASAKGREEGLREERLPTRGELEREREKKVPSYLRELVSGLDVGLAVLKGKSGLLDLAPLVWEEAEAANGEGRPVATSPFGRMALM